MNQTTTKPDIITIAKGMGFFVSHMSYNTEDHEFGFYEPWQTMSQHFETADEAEAAGRVIAEDMGLEFHPWTGCYRTCGEAAVYNHHYREAMLRRKDAIATLTDGLTGAERQAVVRKYFDENPTSEMLRQVEAAYKANMEKADA